jgi:hypothetical protein
MTSHAPTPPPAQPAKDWLHQDLFAVIFLSTGTGVATLQIFGGGAEFHQFNVALH